jgi:hypothetical protein
LHEQGKTQHLAEFLGKNLQQADQPETIYRGPQLQNHEKWYGLVRARYLDLAEGQGQVLLNAVAFNLKSGLFLLPTEEKSVQNSNNAGKK